MSRTFKSLDPLQVKPALQSVRSDMAITDRPVVTDLTLSTHQLDPHTWHRLEKELYLHTALTSKQQAWIYVKIIDEGQISEDDLVVMDVRVGSSSPNTRSGLTLESRPFGVWISRSHFAGHIGQTVTAVDVLFGTDAVDPRPHWYLIPSPLQLNADPEAPVAKLTVLHGRVKPKPDVRPTLRVQKGGKFKIVQLSDTHMVTGVGTCRDAIDAEGKERPECDADPLTVDFIAKILDIEQPDLVVLTGDQLHHDIPDSQSALFKVVAPIIERSIPFAVIFGNHDSEGCYALSREWICLFVDRRVDQFTTEPPEPCLCSLANQIPGAAQMSILQDLPFSLCEAGPEHVDGIGNFCLQILAPAPSRSPLSTLYFLDSHGQTPSEKRNPDYQPITQDQIDWFTDTSKAQREARKEYGNGGSHLSLVFLHIPFPEFGDPDLLISNGHRREPTEGPSLNTHFYDALVREGVSAVGCGHDHVNDFCALLPSKQQQDGGGIETGPYLCYGGCCGFGGYCSYGRDRFYRRMRIWDLETASESLKTWKRVEYAKERVDELWLVQNGAVACPPEQSST